jgi:putative membrane protein
MRHFLFRLLVTSIAFLVVANVLPGFKIDNPLALFGSALILGLFNAFLRPVMVFLTLPLTFFTFGLFIFIINGLILYLTSYLVAGFHIQSFWTAILASILISVVSGIINWLAKGNS